MPMDFDQMMDWLDDRALLASIGHFAGLVTREERWRDEHLRQALEEATDPIRNRARAYLLRALHTLTPELIENLKLVPRGGRHRLSTVESASTYRTVRPAYVVNLLAGRIVRLIDISRQVEPADPVEKRAVPAGREIASIHSLLEQLNRLSPSAEYGRELEAYHAEFTAATCEFKAAYVEWDKLIESLDVLVLSVSAREKSASRRSKLEDVLQRVDAFPWTCPPESDRAKLADLLPGRLALNPNTRSFLFTAWDLSSAALRDHEQSSQSDGDLPIEAFVRRFAAKSADRVEDPDGTAVKPATDRYQIEALWERKHSPNDGLLRDQPPVVLLPVIGLCFSMLRWSQKLTGPADALPPLSAENLLLAVLTKNSQDRNTKFEEATSWLKDLNISPQLKIEIDRTPRRLELTCFYNICDQFLKAARHATQTPAPAPTGRSRWMEVGTRALIPSVSLECLAVLQADLCADKTHKDHCTLGLSSKLAAFIGPRISGDEPSHVQASEIRNGLKVRIDNIARHVHPPALPRDPSPRIGLHECLERIYDNVNPEEEFRSRKYGSEPDCWLYGKNYHEALLKCLPTASCDSVQALAELVFCSPLATPEWDSRDRYWDTAQVLWHFRGRCDEFRSSLWNPMLNPVNQGKYPSPYFDVISVGATL